MGAQFVLRSVQTIYITSVAYIYYIASHTLRVHEVILTSFQNISDIIAHCLLHLFYDLVPRCTGDVIEYHLRCVQFSREYSVVNGIAVRATASFTSIGESDMMER